MTIAPMRSRPLAIDRSHPVFAGHFPDRPIVPGAMLLDHGLRALAAALDGAPVDRWAIGQAKFLSPVGPGEPLTLEFHESGAGYALRIRAGADDRIAMTASVVPQPGPSR